VYLGELTEMNVMSYIELIHNQPRSIISSIGLFLDILGAIIIFLYGVPKIIPVGGNVIVVAGKNEEEEKKEERYECIARVGLGFLILGFILQLVGIWL
jgi:hypothetical protein